MKKLITTKYVADEWECWKDEQSPCWYIGKIGTKTYLATTYTESNARLITAAPDLRKLVQKLAELHIENYLIELLIYEARSLLDCIDDKEAEHEGTE